MNPKFIPLLIVPPLLGWLFLQLCFRKSQLPLKNLFSFFFAPAAGFALISLSLFICYVFQPQQARLITVILPWLYILILMALLASKLGHPAEKKLVPCVIQSCFSLNRPLTPLKILHTLFNWILLALMLYTFADFIGHVANYMTWNAHGGWDARYFWHLKSRFLFRDPEQWRLLFSEHLRWGNNDYPLMVPGIIAWGWHFAGREALLWPMIVSLVFVCSLGGLVIWYLAAWHSWISAFAAGVFFFTLPSYIFWGGTMYCDIPYAFFSNGALLLLISALRIKDLSVLALSAFLAGCSAFTKNEGLVFIGWYGLLALTALGWNYPHSKKHFFQSLIAIGSGLLIPLAVCAYFKIELTGGHANLIGKSSPADIFAALTNWPRNKVIFEGFRMYMADKSNWNGLWFIFLAAALYWPIARKISGRRYTGLLLAAIILINLGYALIFTITPHSIYKHIETALMRLLLQTGALALVFTFEVFGFARKVKS